MIDQALLSSESNEWYTPAKYVDVVREFFGGEIALDPCSSELANRTVKANRYFTLEDNALTRPWYAINAFMNPPYGKVGNDSQAGIFCQYLIDQHRYGNLGEGVILVNSCTGAGWFQSLFDESINFVDHRIRYEVPPLKDDACWNEVMGSILLRKPEAKRIELFKRLEPKTKDELIKYYYSQNQPTKDNVFVYVGERVQEFADHFKQFGRIRIASKHLKRFLHG